MPRYSIPIRNLVPLVGWLNISTNIRSQVSTSGIVAYLRKKFPTLEINLDGNREVFAVAHHTAFGIEKLEQFVDFTNAIKGPSRFKLFLQARTKSKPHIEILVLEKDLPEVIEWLVEKFDPSQYLIIKKYEDCILVCLEPENALRFKLWYPAI